MAKDKSDGIIDPDMAYTLEGAARAMGCAPDWLRKNLIYTGDIPAVVEYNRRYVWVTGRQLIRWIESKMTHFEETD